MFNFSYNESSARGREGGREEEREREREITGRDREREVNLAGRILDTQHIVGLFYLHSSSLLLDHPHTPQLVSCPGV